MIRNSWNVGEIQSMRKQCVPGLPSPLAEGLGTRLPGLYDVWLCIMFFQRLTNRMTIHFIIIDVCKDYIAHINILISLCQNSNSK